MTTLVKMPQLGESVVEGTVARWLKAPGDTVTKLEPLLEITTDKIDTEVPAPADGTLLEILVPEGQTVRAGATLAYIGKPEQEAQNGERRTQNAEPQKNRAEVARPADTAPAKVQAPDEKPTGRAFVSPVVGRMAAEHRIDLDQVRGSGLGGRVTKKDLLAYVEQRQQSAAQELAGSEETEQLEQVAPAPVIQSSSHPVTQSPTLSPDEFLQPLTAMRRAIAQHMTQSVQTSPHVTTVFEVEMTAVVRHREANKAAFADKGIKLTFTPYFVAAAAAALRAVPELNGRFTPDGLLLNRRVHIGVAVALPQGLIVPVIRDADEKNLQGLARAVNELAHQARTGGLPPDAVRGGTFTITNHGVSGSLIGTPIINQPQVGILGIGAIVKRPVVRNLRATANSASLLPDADDVIVIRPMCYLSFSFDHRVVDGAQADAFLTVVKETLENWVIS
jgi:2-oxoisovalerate dehydrogenase E2 component (dihydrolipoyl transacylase)